MYLLKHDSDEYKIAVKELAKSKTLRWTTVGSLGTPLKRFRTNPLFKTRLGIQGNPIFTYPWPPHAYD